MEQSLNAWSPVYIHRPTGVGMADAALVISLTLVDIAGRKSGAGDP